MLQKETADKIKEWVKNGGTLISEGCPAYHGNNGKAGTKQPNYGMDELFGVKQEHVQFTPDLLENLKIKLNEKTTFYGGVFLQSYTTTTGIEIAKYDDGKVAVVDNSFGKGKTRLIGTFPGYGYYKHQDMGTKQFFKEVLNWAGIEQNVIVDDERINARLQKSENDSFLWVGNHAREDIETEVGISKKFGKIRDCKPVWGEEFIVLSDNHLKIKIPARDMLVLKLDY